MKKIRLLILALSVSMAFFSCSKDDEIALVSGNKYETTYIKMSLTGDFTFTVEYKTKQQIIDNEAYFILDFKVDGTFYANDVPSGTWVQSGSTITVTDGSDVLTGAISGNVFKISTTENDETGTMTTEIHFTKI